jgi:hypothetical protein
MLKQLSINLLLTTIISMFIAMVYLMINEHFMLMDFDMSFYTVATMVLFLQVISLITALPALLLCIPSIIKNPLKRLAAYFLLIAILFSASIFLCIMNEDFLETFALSSFPIVIFMTIHTIFYLRLIKNVLQQIMHNSI